MDDIVYIPRWETRNERKQFKKCFKLSRYLLFVISTEKIKWPSAPSGLNDPAGAAGPEKKKTPVSDRVTLSRIHRSFLLFFCPSVLSIVIKKLKILFFLFFPVHMRLKLTVN